MKKYKYLVAALLVLLLLLLLVKNRQLKNSIVNVDENVVFTSEEEVQQVDEIETIAVTAENNTFSPSVINTQYLKPVLLQITAVDRDYSFVHEDSELDVDIPMGETVEVRIDPTFVGESKFTCGVGCEGLIISIQVGASDLNGEGDF